MEIREREAERDFVRMTIVTLFSAVSALVQFEVYGTYTVEYRSECGFCAITVRGFWELQC